MARSLKVIAICKCVEMPLGLHDDALAAISSWVSGARQLLLEAFERRSCSPARRQAFRPRLWRVFARDNPCNEEPVPSAPTLRAFATTVETRSTAGLAWVREFSSHLALPSGG
jgi:hypothetical protein